MNNTIVLTILVENSVYNRGLMAEHGLAFHIQAGETSMLFDTGQSALLSLNAKTLGIDLSRLQAVALSHGHYDHTGGLCAISELAPGAPLYAHPAALTPRFARNSDGTTRAVGISESSLAVIQAHPSQMQLKNGMAEVLPGFYLTGEIPRLTGFEDVGGPFALDAAGTQLDAITDDQALFFDTRDGVVVLLGCAHAGVVNTLRYIRRLTHDRPIHAVLGGMHLLNANPERMLLTAQALQELGVQKLGPAHCTGPAATGRLWHEFSKACVSCAVGSRFLFHP